MSRMCSTYLCFCMSREGTLHVICMSGRASGCVVLREASSSFPGPSCPSFGQQGLLRLGLCSVFQKATCDIRGTQSCAHQKPWPTLATLQPLCRVFPTLPFALPCVSSSLPVSSSAPNPRVGCGREEAGALEGGSPHLGSPASQSGGKVWAQAPCPWDWRAHQRSSCPPEKSGAHHSEELLLWVCQVASSATAYPPGPRSLLSPSEHWLTAR